MCIVLEFVIVHIIVNVILIININLCLFNCRFVTYLNNTIETINENW